MAAPTTLPALLASLTQSLSLTQEAAPKIADIEHPKDGISLLDVKNELLLSYLQNLVFLILLKLRNAKSDSEDNTELDDAVRSKLVELRLYLERGARPLEEKLRFSIERFLRTAQDAQREEKSKEQKSASKNNKDSDSEAESDAASDEEESEQEQEQQPRARRGKMSAAPNLGTMVDEISTRRDGREDGPAGIYRPPRRDRAVMEPVGRPRERAERKTQKSYTMEEFVNDELSAAPMAEPSIGTTIVQGGRKMKTVSERKDEDERRDYEESNFTRLPKESKKDKAKKAKAAGHSNRMQFGGEEWHNLGEGVDRIDRLTKRKGLPGGGVRAMLEKSRKRGHDTTDGPRGSGHVEMGERFHKKAKMLEAGRRDRGKNR